MSKLNKENGIKIKPFIDEINNDDKLFVLKNILKNIIQNFLRFPSSNSNNSLSFSSSFCKFTKVLFVLFALFESFGLGCFEFIWEEIGSKKSEGKKWLFWFIFNDKEGLSHKR